MSKYPKLRDNSKMPFGKYEGVEMIDVPAIYLLSYLKWGKEGSVMDYCLENKEALEQELQK